MRKAKRMPFAIASERNQKSLSSLGFLGWYLNNSISRIAIRAMIVVGFIKNPMRLKKKICCILTHLMKTQEWGDISEK